MLWSVESWWLRPRKSDEVDNLKNPSEFTALQNDKIKETKVAAKIPLDFIEIKYIHNFYHIKLVFPIVLRA
jgi:hypothetical protein